jgi:hypothetical protein
MSKTARKLYSELDEAVLDGTELLIVEIAGRKKKVTGVPAAGWNKHITVESPISGDTVLWFRLGAATTVEELVTVIDSGTSVVLTIKHATNRSLTGTTVYTGTCSNSTTGAVITTFSDETIPADSFVWLIIGTVTGTVGSVHLDMNGTVD